jgi:hypothetical protein
MTIIKCWQCDSCKKNFFEGDGGYLSNTSFIIDIPQSGQYDVEVKFTFKDICLKCKTDLANTIEKFLEEKGKLK